MEKRTFNKDWICYPEGKPEEAVSVTLPHDAMLRDPRDPQAPSGENLGWYVPRNYCYEKRFFVPEQWKEKRIRLEFEGVAREARVLVNGEQAGSHDYGYTGFSVPLEEFLHYGEENCICVRAFNASQPASRWYTGTGIYRPVWLCLSPEEHILRNGVRVTTLDYRNPEIQVEVRLEGQGEVQVSVLDGKQLLAQGVRTAKEHTAFRFLLPGARLWSPENPRLYTCQVCFRGEKGTTDTESVVFGLRQTECTSEKGFLLNGERVILKGACIHHDNGILGACAYDFAEERKVRILKENGYNAIRSAHNPCSRALLEACDRLGMLVLDEYADMWYIHKTPYDYASRVEKNWKRDLKELVDRDYNHPSVIMYSTGNEVSETAQKRGIRLCGEMTRYLHGLDKTRPVTCGVNIFFNFLSSMGMGVYSDKKAEKQKKSGKKKAVGSQFFNSIAGIFGSGFMKWGATLPPCDWKTRDAFARMDVAGYNYGIRRYRRDLKHYPGRLILGTETFCSDAFRFYELAKKEPRIIGDFVWSGMDYLGETGIGAWEYEDYAPGLEKKAGWLTAGAGRIDLTGKPLAEMAYIRVAFGLQDIALAVMPVNHTRDRHSPSAWKMSNALESWSWRGCEGKKARVEVYARASRVRIFINGNCVGEKRLQKDCRTEFDTIYQSGEIRAEAYDEAGKKIAETTLKTAGEETVLRVEPEQMQIERNRELCYVRLRYTDGKGLVKPLARGEIRLEVKGGTLLGAGSACPYYPGSYLDNKTDTYYGEALAVIRPEAEDRIQVTAYSRYGNSKAEIRVVSGKEKS